MSILGYSAAYFLPQYWVNTPLYGEKLIPLLDYVLSTDYERTDLLASAFYNIESKYKNTSDLPIQCIEEIIKESGYGYVRDLLGQDDESLKLLVYILVLIHQLKGSKRGIEAVLELLRSPDDALSLFFVGDPKVSEINEVSEFSEDDYVFYTNFSATESFDTTFQIRTGSNFFEEQCIASSENHGFYLGIDTEGHLVLKVGQQISGVRSWQQFGETDKVVSSRALALNTNYYIVFSYTGSEYLIKVSTDGNKYLYYTEVLSDKPLGIYGGNIYLGIDMSEGAPQYPFQGHISLAPFTHSSNNLKIEQWFESLPVGKENTFKVESELDVSLISTGFFSRFGEFIQRYVYPTLATFKAKLMMRCKLTYLPYIRQRVTYIASNVTSGYEAFMVQEELNEEEHIPFEVEGGREGHTGFLVQQDSDD